MSTAEQAPLVEALCRALADSGARLSGVMRRVSDPGVRAVGTWSIGETAQHVAEGPGYFLTAARGEADLVALDDVAADNAQQLAKNPERDPSVLADRFNEGIGALVSYAPSPSARQPGPIILSRRWHKGYQVGGEVCI